MMIMMIMMLMMFKFIDDETKIEFQPEGGEGLDQLYIFLPSWTGENYTWYDCHHHHIHQYRHHHIDDFIYDRSHQNLASAQVWLWLVW